MSPGAYDGLLPSIISNANSPFTDKTKMTVRVRQVYMGGKASAHSTSEIDAF